MTCFPKKLFLIGSMIALTACGGSGNSGGDTEQPTLFFGSTDPAVSRSGLDYADGTQSADDLQGVTHTVRLAGVAGDFETDTQVKFVLDEALTITQGTNGDDFTLTIGDETITFADGRIVGNDTFTGFGSFIAGQHANRFSFVLLDDTNGPFGREFFGVLTTGFETNPETIGLNTGSVRYTGDIDGSADRGSGFESFNGTFVLEADFDTDEVSGEVSLDNLVSVIGISEPVTYDITPTEITGNGFAGDLNLVNCAREGCVSEGEISGVFYGPEADQVAGVLFVDIAAPVSNGNLVEFTAVGNYGGDAAP